MRNAIAVIVEMIRKEFYQIRQDKRMLVISIAAPVIQVLLLGYAATTDIKYTHMVVCDMDKTRLSREFVRGFTNSGYFIEKFAVQVPDDADPYIERGEAAVILVVPRGFGNRLVGKEMAHIQAVFDGTDANSANILIAYASQIVQTYSQNVRAEYALKTPNQKFARILPEPRIWFNPELRSSNFMVPGVVALVLMIITMTLTSLGIVKEKEMGTLDQLMVTPIKPYQLILGKLLPFVVIGFIDVALVLAVARFWFKVPMAGNVFLLFGLSGLFILTTLGLGIFISTIAKSQQQAMLIAQFFFFMPFMFISGFAFPIANMPTAIQYVSYLIPLRYFLEIVRGIFLKGTDLSHLWPQVLALAFIGVLILSLSVKRFRKTIE